MLRQPEPGYPYPPRRRINHPPWHPFASLLHRYGNWSAERDWGQKHFRADVNRILARNGIGFELAENGQMTRLGPPILREQLAYCTFDTGDTALDQLLENARSRFLNPDALIRRDSLEKLWDAWERLKTINPGRDKKASMSLLLERASPEPGFRDRLDQEARAVTDIGNHFGIRHSETSQVQLELDEHVDYLFHRLFALIWLLVSRMNAA